MGGDDLFKVNFKVVQIELKPIREIAGLQKIYVRFGIEGAGFKDIKIVRTSRDGVMNFKRNNTVSLNSDPDAIRGSVCMIEVYGIFDTTEKNGVIFSTKMPAVACHVNGRIKAKIQLIREIQTTCTGNITFELAIGTSTKPFDKYPLGDIDIEAIKVFENERKAKREAEEHEEEDSTAYSSNRSTKKSKSSTKTILKERNEKEIVHKIRKVLETLPIEILDYLEKNQTLIYGCVEDFKSQENDMNIY